MQLPNVCIVDCDRNLDGCEKFLRSVKKDLDYKFVAVTYNDDGSPVPVEKCFDRLLEHLTDIADGLRTKRYNFRFVALDGLTVIGELIKFKILYDQKRTAMEARDWDAYKQSLVRLLVAKLRNLGCNTVVTCHEIVLSKADPKNIMTEVLLGYRPAVQGGIQDTFNGFFTDVWGCTNEPAPGGTVEYKLTTTRTSHRDLKNSLGLPDTITIKKGELIWPKLEPYFKDLP